jgi:hypothetical protein
MKINLHKFRIIIFSLALLTIFYSCQQKNTYNTGKMSSETYCKFNFFTPNKTIEVVKSIFISKSESDNVFFKGDFDVVNKDFVNYTISCPNCKMSCFKINLGERLRYNIDELVKKKIILTKDIEEHQIVKKSKLIENHYNMIFGGTPTYSFVRCGNCKKEYLTIIGLREVQHGFYYAQSQGLWEINE